MSNKQQENLSNLPQEENVPPTPPSSPSPSRQTSLEPPSNNSAPKTSSEIDKTQMSNFFKNYDLSRLYAFYGIYYKLRNLIPDYIDTWEKFNKTTNELVRIKRTLELKGHMRDDYMAKTVGEMNEQLIAFQDKLNTIGESDKKFTKEFNDMVEETDGNPDHKDKIKHYSRFIRVIRNAKNDGTMEIPKNTSWIIALLRVNVYETMLWNDAIATLKIPGTLGSKVNSSPKVSKPDNSLIKVQKNKNGKPIWTQKWRENSKPLNKDAVNTFLDSLKDSFKDYREENREEDKEDDNICAFIGILKVIPTDENSPITGTPTDKNLIFNQEKKDLLIKRLESIRTNLYLLKDLKKDNSHEKHLYAIPGILADATKYINEVEYYLDDRKRLFKDNGYKAIREEIEKKENRNALSLFIATYLSVLMSIGSADGPEAALFTLIIYIIGFLILIVIVVFSAPIYAGIHVIYKGVTGPFVLALFLLRKILKFIERQTNKPGLAQLDDWKKCLGSISPCKTNSDEKCIQTSYEYLVVIMLYTKLRYNWDSLTSPIFKQPVEPRKTFMMDFSKTKAFLSKLTVFWKSKNKTQKITNKIELPTNQNKNTPVKKTRNYRGNIYQPNSQVVLKTRIGERVKEAREATEARANRALETKKTKPIKNVSFPTKPESNLKYNRIGTSIGGTRRPSKTRRRR
jgi:hypothetical protein